MFLTNLNNKEELARASLISQRKRHFGGTPIHPKSQYCSCKVSARTTASCLPEQNHLLLS